MHSGRLPSSAIVLSALATLASARDIDLRWKPARETGLPSRVGDGGGLDVDVVGLLPATTEISRRPSELVDTELFKRYQMSSDTCGFAAEYKSLPWTCFKVGAKCTTTGSHMGCCVDDFPQCQSSFLTTCVDFATVPSSCGTGTLCCSNTASPGCFTWLFSSSTDPAATYSILNCSPTGGIGTLLDAPPTISAPGTSAKTSTSSPSATSSSTTTTTSASPPTPTQTDNPSPTPIGPIVGGALGGVAIIGIAAVAIFYLLVRHKRRNKAKPPGAGGLAPGGAFSPGGGGMYYAPGASPTLPPGAGQGQPHYDPLKNVHVGGQQAYPAYGQPGWAPSPEHTAYGHQQGWGSQGMPLQNQSPPRLSELGTTSLPPGTQAHRAELEQ